jgi:GMP reductase
MIIHETEALDFSDVLLVPRISRINSRADVDLLVRTRLGRVIVPIVAANMDHVGTFDMAKKLAKYQVTTALIKHYTIDAIIEFLRDNPEVAPYVWLTSGVQEDNLNKLATILETIESEKLVKPLGICLDVANGYTEAFKRVVKQACDNHGKHYLIMAGNVVTRSIAIEFSEIGVDYVKVGIGSGAVCTTRKETGVGCPQFAAIVNSWSMLSKGICSDGGITCPGDVVKAFAAGASMVMIGSEFAGHDEGYDQHELYSYGNGGYIVKNKYLPHYGMSSKWAQTLYNGGVANYRSSEGKEVSMEAKGEIKNTIERYLAGIRSGMSYCNWKNIPSMIGDGVFMVVRRQLNESLGK